MKHAKHIVLGLLLVTALLVATGCTPTPAAWPGLAADGEAVYVTLLDGRIHALNPDTGNEMWVFPPASERRSGLGCTGPAQPSAGLFASPFLTEESVFVGSYNGQVHALDKTNGNQRWSFVGQEETNASGLSGFFSGKQNPAVIGSLTLDGDTLYVPSASRNLYAVDATSGLKKWDFQADSAIWATPLPIEDRIYVAAMDHYLYCLDKGSREEVWSFDAEGAIPSTPALAGDTIYLSSLARKVFAVDADTGEERWSFEMDSWAWATPLVVSDTVYASEVDGVLYALDAETGAQRWQFPSQGKIGKIQAAPAYADGTLYLASEDGNLYVLEAATGTKKWHFAEPGNRGLMTTPVLVSGTLYVGAINTKSTADNKIYALNAESGAIMWEYPISEE